jgi:hypothetical protein
MSRQVNIMGRSLGKDNSGFIHTARLCLVVQIANSGRVIAKQPQNTTLNLQDYPHPKIESLRENLIGIIETTKYKTPFRQPKLKS